MKLQPGLVDSMLSSWEMEWVYSIAHGIDTDWQQLGVELTH